VGKGTSWYGKSKKLYHREKDREREDDQQFYI
jgi:hypothetical protein